VLEFNVELQGVMATRGAALVDKKGEGEKEKLIRVAPSEGQSNWQKE